MAASDEYGAIIKAACVELQSQLLAVDAASIESLLSLLQEAKRVAVYGVGREGLAMKGFAMRLHHLGLQVSVVGEMTAQPVGPGDVLLVSAGPGYFSTVAALAGVARKAGAGVVAFSSQPPPQPDFFADLCVQLPAVCMEPALDGQPHGASADGKGPSSVLPMGSSYELALQLFCDAACLLLQRRRATAEASMDARHTNLE